MDFLNVDSIRQNKSKSIFALSIPAIISMVLMSLISVADGFFMGNFIHKDAIAAVNLGLPIIYLFLATGLMIGVGGSVISTMETGAKNFSRANACFRQTMATTAVTVILLSAVTFFLLKPILHILGAVDLVAEFFLDYYSILLLELPFMILNSVFGMFVRAEGKPQFYAATTFFTVILNIILDWIFAARLGFGVRGIAFASLISALAGFFLMIFWFVKKSEIYSLGKFKFDREIMAKTFLNGSSEGIGELSMLVCMFSYNYVIMRRGGVDGVTAFSVVGYVSYIFSMIVIGFGQGSSTLSGICFGAGEKGLAVSVRKRTNLFVVAAGILVCAMILVFSGKYAASFVSDSEIQKMIVRGLRIFMVTFVISPLNAISSFYFTSIGKAKESAVISSLRGLVLLIAAIFILPVFFGMDGIWLTSPAAEFLTLFVTARYLCKK